jgi:aspartate/methionine/tyrosine aminotransferase
MAGVEPFYVLEVVSRAHELEKQGRSIIHMEIGVPDFATPPPVLDACSRILRNGHLPYTLSLGLPALREAISRFYRDRYDVAVPPDRIIVTAGSSGALLLATGVLIDPGDQVLMTDPGYPSNRQFIRVFGGKPVGIPVGPETAFQLTPEVVERSWTDETTAVIVASPANPTGTMIDADALRGIAEVVSRRGGRLIVDEIYHGLTYGTDARTAASLSDQVFVINSFSKYFYMTGWRLGWMVCPREYVRDIEKLAQHLFISPSAPAQHAALAAFEPETITILEQRRKEFEARRNFMMPALRDLGFSIPVTPQGAFYVYAGCERFSPDSFAFALEMLETAGVAVTPGKDFGTHRPERYLRFAYTTSMETLREGTDRLRRFLSERKRR